MKKTLDLPADLVEQLQVRALHDGLKLEDAITNLLRKSLAEDSRPLENGDKLLTTDEITGLPLIECRHPADKDLTPTRISEILLEQEIPRSS